MITVLPSHTHFKLPADNPDETFIMFHPSLVEFDCDGNFYINPGLCNVIEHPSGNVTIVPRDSRYPERKVYFMVPHKSTPKTKIEICATNDVKVFTVGEYQIYLISGKGKITITQRDDRNSCFNVVTFNYHRNKVDTNYFQIFDEHEEKDSVDY